MISGLGSATGSATAAMQGPGGKMGKEEFLQLLVAQLSNQDPMNPADGQEFAAQLAQFTSVEQLISLNETLETQGQLQMELQSQFQNAVSEALNGTAAMGAIGRTVVIDGNHLGIGADGTGSAVFEVDGSGGEGSLRILDAEGNQVATVDLGRVAGGRHRVEIDAETLGLPAGTYTYAVDVETPEGGEAKVTTYSTVIADGIRFGPEGPVLTAGSLTIPLGDVLEILSSV